MRKSNVLPHTILSHTLKATSALSLAVFLEVTSLMPSWAMKEDEGSLGSISRMPKLETYADLVSKIKEKDLLFMNVGYGMVQSCTKVSEKNAPSLFEQHETFINFIKTKSEADYNDLIKKTKLSSGEELVKVGEKGLPDLLEDMSNRGVNIIPLSSRGDDGKCGTEDETEILSRTEREFVSLNYNWKNWNKFTPFQNLNIEIVLQDNKPDIHRAYKWRNNIIYSTRSKIPQDAPHKSAAIVGVVNILKEAEQLPAAIYVTDREKTIKEIREDLKNTDLGINLHINKSEEELKDAGPGIPLYLLSYSHPPAFQTPEDLKEFYIHRLGEKFRTYESQFNEVFYSLK